MIILDICFKNTVENKSPAISTSTPLVTALICNYNYGRYLGEAIESAINQTWKNTEIIVVDDGSTDESREVLKNYEGRIRVILKENGGQASAFNAGIAAARGEIICFLDSDDFWSTNKVAMIVAMYKEAPWGLICNELVEVNERGVTISGKPYTQANNFSLKSGDVLQHVLDNGFTWVFSPTSGLNITMDIAKKIFPIPENDWRICADGPLAYGAMCHAPVGVINTPLGGYRLHNNNAFASLRSNNAASCITKITNRADRYLYLKSHLNLIGKNDLINTDLKSIYPYYRSCCFVTRINPLHNLLTLWKRNIQHYLINSNTMLMPLFNSVRYILLDTLLCILMIFNLPTPYRTLRETYSVHKETLNPSTREYLEHD